MSHNATLAEPVLRTAPRRRVATFLQRELAATKTGGSLPSMRHIMRSCRVSQLTVQTVVRELSARGLIEARPQRGLYKAGKARAVDLAAQLDLIYCGLQRFIDDKAGPNFHTELSSHLSRLCGERWQGVRLHGLPLRPTDEDFDRVVSRAECRACIVVGTPRMETDRIFRQYEVPAVHLFPVSAETPPHSIVTDPAEVVRKQLDHLTSLGHRRIAYLHGIEEWLYHRDLMMRREQFYRMVAERGLPMRPQWVRYGGYDAETMYRVLHEMFSDAQRPTAIIVGDINLFVAYQVLGELGLSVGGDVSVVGTNDLSLARHMRPPATTLREPRLRAVQMALDHLDRLLQGEDVPLTEVLPVDLVIRESTGKVREA